MTSDELQAIKARVDAATPGPWTTVACGPEGTEDNHIEYVRAPNKRDVVTTDCNIYTSDEDATFIAHARTDVPALVAEVERLREALQRIAEYPNAEMFTSLAPAHEMRRIAQFALVTEEERVRLLREGRWDEEVK